MKLARRGFYIAAAVAIVYLSLVAISIMVPLAHGQSKPCPQIIDGAGILKDQNVVLSGINQLVNEGADPRVVTVSSLGAQNLKFTEDTFEAACPDWLGPNHVRKSNLIVFLVAPNDRKKNIFFGAAYSPVFPTEDSVNTLYSHAANPYFANREWERGLSAAMKDFSAKIVAYHDQQQHPITPPSTVIHQEATDFHGLWTVMFWALMLGGCAGVALLILKLLAIRRERSEAQSVALDEFRRANDAYVHLPQTHPRLAQLSQTFSTLSSMVRYNPNEDMSAAEYRAAGNAWRDFRKQIENPATATSYTNSAAGTGKVGAGQPGRKKSSQPDRPAPTTPPTPPAQTTVVVQQSGSSSDGLVDGILIDEALRSREREPYPDPPRRYRDPDPEPDPPSQSSSSSSSSGSDSSWSSSDSGGGFGGAGSDSSFGGGDSGGGGGGGSDSGW